MAQDLYPGIFKIISLSLGSEKGNTHVTPHPLPYQPVRLGEQTALWEIKREPDDIYHLHLHDSYPYTGVVDKKVVASVEKDQEVKWRIIRSQSEGAYTITLPILGPFEEGWTVGEDEYPEVVIRPIPPVGIPAPPNQLFRFERILDE